MRFDVIVNTTARQYRTRTALIDRMAGACSGAASLHATSSLTELEEVCRELARRGTDLIALSGGDGSFMAGVTALVRAFGEDALPPLALLPGGTVATVARNWGMVGDPAVLLRRLLRERRGANGGVGAIRRATLRVSAATRQGTEERIGFIFGTGLVAKFFDVYYESGGDGYDTAARIVARIFVESFYGGAFSRRVLDPLPCTVDVEGLALAPRAWSLICASVVRDLGIHMHVTYRAGEDLARPHLVASALLPGELGPRAPLVLAGRRLGGRDHFDDLVRDFTIRFDADTDASMPGDGPYILDGDRLRAREVRISAGPPIDVVALAGR
jgi:diacylglycerol kinase (ATP)